MGCSAVKTSTERLAAGLEVRRHAEHVELFVFNEKKVTKRYTLTFSNVRDASFLEGNPVTVTVAPEEIVSKVVLQSKRKTFGFNYSALAWTS